ncbi:MAG: ParB/RepB/Spo0J family partition protein [Bacilli bacterium]|nr:ParB/RepB/Spo0J family partition protein [Bacilli bacterium]
MESQVQNINIDLIIPNRFQPRLSFDEKALNELAESIKQHGIIQPLIVRKLADKYEIIAGERRYKAATLAGLSTVPVIVTNLSDAKSAEVALVENIQRKNLSSIEEALSYKRKIDKDNLTQEQLAKLLGLSQSTVANRLRLLNLSNEVQDALLKEKISERHARSLLQISDKNKQTELLNRIITERLTVRQLDEIIKKELSSPSTYAEEVPSNLEQPLSSEPEAEPIPEQTPSTQIESLDVLGDDNTLDNSNNVFDTEIDASMPSETLEEIDKEPQHEEPMSNILNFLQSFNNSAPSLDDEPTNMQTFDDDVFNDVHSAYDLIDDANKDPDIVNLDTVNESSVTSDNQVLDEVVPRIKSGDMSSLKKAYHDLQDEAEKAGFKISMEDFDFEDLYQMIIKVDK